MHKRTAEGGVVTLDENQDHTLWPCIQHDPSIPCDEALRMWQDPRGRRILYAQEARYARYPTPPR
jgi:hypothetical protein